MEPAIHLESQTVCPYLPFVETPLRAVAMKQCGDSRGADFYQLALECAQSLWLQGLPAQSLLLINRAMGADHLSEPSMCDRWPMPYAAAAWVMASRSEAQFIGNPRRHYQHLATRMVEPRKEIRSWRAWGCWYLACQIFPDFPADHEQLVNEQIVEPAKGKIFAGITQFGVDSEAEVWRQTVDHLKSVVSK